MDMTQKKSNFDQGFSLRASLRVVLMADDVPVAEIDDPKLWRDLFAGIRPPQTGRERERGRAPAAETALAASREPEETRDPIEALAVDVGVAKEVLLQAMGPTPSPPYLQLDAGCFDAFKRATPRRGTRAISPIVLALTLLGLWKDALGRGPASIKEARAILNGIGVRDWNADRAAKSCEWLGIEGAEVRVDPGRILTALALAKSYCVAGQRPPPT
jgi:hypothetical protein